jgi:hypothetical protein
MELYLTCGQSKSGQSKRQKTVNEYLIREVIQKQNPIIDKKFITNLIAIKDSSIGFKSIESKKSYFNLFKRVEIEGRDTDYVRCDKCLISIKCISQFGTSSVLRHKC